MAWGTLSVTRRWGGPFYSAGGFEVAVDGTTIGAVRAMETVDLPVEAGSHELRIGRGRHLSPTRTFELAEGETVEFWCRGVMLPPLLLAALLKPELWITLRPAG